LTDQSSVLGRIAGVLVLSTDNSLLGDPVGDVGVKGLVALVVHVGNVPLNLAVDLTFSLKIGVGGLLLSAQVTNRL